MKQRGAALIVSLVMLLLMTMIGIFAMRTGIMQEKMASNLIDRELAEKAAEVALRDAEKTILSWANAPIALPDGANNVWKKNTMAQNPASVSAWWMQADANWWQANGIASPRSVGSIEDPRYIIEEITPLNIHPGTPPSTRYYRVTARGVGGSTQAIVILQSTVQL